MATTIRQVICDEIVVKQDETAELIAVLAAIPRGALDIEADDVRLWSPHWFRITDKSGSLSARLLSVGLQSLDKSGRKKSTSVGMQTNLFLPSSGELACISFDIVQPGKDCKTVRVRVTDERLLTVCGELPSNYEILGILEEA